MPPRAARNPKRDSVSVAIKNRLCKAAAVAVAASDNDRSARARSTATPASEVGAAASGPSSSRVSRRRHDVVPRDTPEWQRMALKTAAESWKSRASAVKAKSNGRRRGAAKGKVASEEDEGKAEANAKSLSPRGEGAEHSASHAELEASSSIGNTHAKPHPVKAEKAAGTPTPKRGQRVPVVELVCPRCKLRMDQWPFCGLSGDIHVLKAPPSAAKEGDEAQLSEAAAAAEAHEAINGR